MLFALFDFLNHDQDIDPVIGHALAFECACRPEVARRELDTWHNLDAVA